MYFKVEESNGGRIIKKILEDRGWLPSDDHTKVQFNWYQTKNHFIVAPNCVYNHIKGHTQLTLKNNLIENLVRHCLKCRAYIWEITPLSFLVTKREITAFEKFLNNKQAISNPYIDPRVNPSLMSQNQCLWLLKPSNLNRGQGIQVFKSIAEVKKIISESKSTDFVIQKYIEQPYLIENRKFDIRLWVLLHDLNVYIYQEGYLRFSSEVFNLQSSDPYVHLTNNAIQKYSEKYCTFEDGNQRSFEFLNTQTEGVFMSKTILKIKQIVVFTIMSMQLQKSKSFELLGYDFMLDCNLKPWLIEVNSHPCLELSSKLLQRLIPEMLEDLIDITLYNRESYKWEHMLQL